MWSFIFGFIACLVLSNLFPKLSQGGSFLVAQGRKVVKWFKEKRRPGTKKVGDDGL